MTGPGGQLTGALPAGGHAPTVISADDPAAVAVAAAALQAGGLVAIPTDTVYGICVLPTADRLDALLAAKRRPAEKGFQLLVDGLDQVEALVLVPVVARRLAAAFWPGPLTLALPLRDAIDVPELITGGRSSLGIRVPDHPVPRGVARLVGPIAVSSANLSGEPPAETADAVLASVGPSLSVLIDDGPVRGGVASTVAGVAPDGALTFFRIGALSEQEIRDAAGS